MHHIEKIVFLLYITAIYGASISIKETDEKNNSLKTNDVLYQTENGDDTSMELMDLLDDPIESDSVTGLSGLEMGGTLAEVVKSLLRILSKMDLTREGLQNVMQLVLALITPYMGKYADVIVPVMSGVATVLVKSLT